MVNGHTHWNQCNRQDVPALLGGVNRYEIAMNLLAYIIVGIVAGWLAEKITGRDHGLIMNLIVGTSAPLSGDFWRRAFSACTMQKGSTCPRLR